MWEETAEIFMAMRMIENLLLTAVERWGTTNHPQNFQPQIYPDYKKHRDEDGAETQEINTGMGMELSTNNQPNLGPIPWASTKHF